jgi:hypothetical protein
MNWTCIIGGTGLLAERYIGCLVVRAARGPRFGWADAARTMRARNEDRLLDEPTTTRFDADELIW